MTADNRHFLPSPYEQLPSLPASGERGPHVCEIIRLYLAVLPDLSLTPAQQAIIDDHLRICAACEYEQQLLTEAEQLISNFSTLETNPSVRVDQAVMAAIAAQSELPAQFSPVPSTPSAQSAPPPSIPVVKRQRPRKRGRLVVLLGQVAMAAILLLALLATLHFASNVLAPATTFALPTNLTWNGYVLYHTQTKVDAQGERYQVQSYHELSSGNMHVETVMPGQMDVVVVKAGQQMLGEDMMHHVAQMDPQGWLVDDSAFDLATLRSDLRSHRAIYLGADTFRDQSVYRVRLPNGLVLLLNMQYQPVNVLQGAVGPGTGAPIYDTLRLIPAQKVPDSTWWTQVPAGFHMGTLPPGP